MTRYCRVVVTQRTYGDNKFYRKKAIKTVSKSNYNAHTEPLFKKLQILKLKDICAFQLSKIMYSFINISLPDPLMTMFIVNRHIHSHVKDTFTSHTYNTEKQPFY